MASWVQKCVRMGGAIARNQNRIAKAWNAPQGKKQVQESFSNFIHDKFGKDLTACQMPRANSGKSY